ncbi:MAG: SDR family NAD(P)-dependent oxidoreductase [Micromonosporaceae bacterium]
MRIRGSSALVTGAASGLGRATAVRLARAGASVMVCDLPGSAGAEVVAELGDTARFVPADVTDPDDVTAALDAAEQLAPLRAVVNCAGIGLVGRVLTDDRMLPLEAFTAVIEVNLVGTFNVIRLAAERIARTDPVDGERGVVVNTASVAAYDGQIGQAAYAASKAGIAGMSLPLARDLADRLIRVVTIAPGMFDTPLLAVLPEKARTALAAQVPHPQRLGRPEEFGALVEHVIANPMLNGEVIRLDGALRMTPR